MKCNCFERVRVKHRNIRLELLFAFGMTYLNKEVYEGILIKNKVLINNL